jgi:CubicO group peptidase (beta-lactamase class C family)
MITKRSFPRTFIFAALSLIAVAVVANAQSKAKQIDTLMKQYHALGQFNGSVLVADNGKVLYSNGLGLANMEWNAPNKPDTKFRLASITKQFTAAAILQLVEQGKIKLDGHITDYLPEYRKDTGEKVTIHQLLNHTSGIPSYTDQPGFFQNVSRNRFSVKDFVKKYTEGDLQFEPGSKFAYNNSAYFLLGAIIERVSGKTYEQYLKDNIFTPLGMKNTGYDWNDPLISNRASGYSRTPKGYVNAPYLDMSIPYAAGSLYSTVEDMYLWDQALYTDKILSAKSRELMFKPNLENYGYGFTIREIKFGDAGPGTREITHSGGINGFSTLIVRLVDAKQTIILLDNTEQGRWLGPIRQNIANILHGVAVIPPKRPIGETIAATAVESGAEAAIKQYRDLKASKPNEYDFNEGELNAVGYQLLRSGKTKDAIEIFKLNVEMFPAASNPYDSLGEAYVAGGEKELALKNYRRSVELDPKNEGGIAAIKRLEAPEIVVDTKALDSYAGKYELMPNFVLTVTAENGKLFGEPTGQPKFELVPVSADKFAIPQVRAEFTFVKGDGGAVTSVVLHQGGRELTGKKLE